MSLGVGLVYSSSKKQKLNTKSSTEAELVGADDVLPQALWTRYFLEEQGYGVTTTLYQDNQSAIKLESNGKSSSTKRTRHLNIRYFFITDRISKRELTVVYCPTKKMVADYFTKPLQGELFRKFRDQILGMATMESIPPVSPPLGHRSVLEIKNKTNCMPRAHAHKIVRAADPGDALAHPGYPKKESKSTPSEALMTNSSLPREFKVCKTKKGTARLIPGGKKVQPGTLTLSSLQQGTSNVGEHRLEKGENGTRNDTTGKLPGPLHMQPQDMTWVDVVRGHNRKV